MITNAVILVLYVELFYLTISKIIQSYPFHLNLDYPSHIRIFIFLSVFLSQRICQIYAQIISRTH